MTPVLSLSLSLSLSLMFTQQNNGGLRAGRVDHDGDGNGGLPGADFARRLVAKIGKQGGGDVHAATKISTSSRVKKLLLERGLVDDGDGGLVRDLFDCICWYLCSSAPLGKVNTNTAAPLLLLTGDCPFCNSRPLPRRRSQHPEGLSYESWRCHPWSRPSSPSSSCHYFERPHQTWCQSDCPAQRSWARRWGKCSCCWIALHLSRW
jgi:hypothetical protein